MTAPDHGARLRAAGRHSAVRYLLVGGASFAIDFGLLWLLRDAVGTPLWVASGAAFLGSFAFNYTLQRYFSFATDAPHGRSLIAYAALVGINTLATIGIVQAADALGIGWAIGKVAATGATTLWNYFAYRYVVFPARRSDDAPASAALAVPAADDGPTAE